MWLGKYNNSSFWGMLEQWAGRAEPRPGLESSPTGFSRKYSLGELDAAEPIVRLCALRDRLWYAAGDALSQLGPEMDAELSRLRDQAEALAEGIEQRVAGLVPMSVSGICAQVHLLAELTEDSCCAEDELPTRLLRSIHSGLQALIGGWSRHLDPVTGETQP